MIDDNIEIAPEGCPVCGWAGFIPLENGDTTFEICSCCGCQAGYTYGAIVSFTHLENVRESWLKLEHGKWWNMSIAPPKGWSVLGQLLFADIPVSAHAIGLAFANEKDETQGLSYLAALLWNDFDPISVRARGAGNEYRSYYSHTAKLISENADEHKFTKYIKDVVCRNMGMTSFPSAEIEILSKRLVAVASKYHSRG